MKLAIISSASRSQDMSLTAVDFHRARIILEETEKKMPMVFGGVGRSQIAPVMNRIIQLLVQEKQVPYEILVRLFSHDVDIVGLNKAIQAIEAGRIGALVLSDGRKILRLMED